jgi:hypothetical protein
MFNAPQAAVVQPNLNKGHHTAMRGKQLQQYATAKLAYKRFAVSAVTAE